MAYAPALSFRPAVIRACAASGDCRSSKKGASGGSWWTPLFGWPAEPDYIGGSEGGAADAPPSGWEKKKVSMASGGGDRPEGVVAGGGGVRFAAFTEEKARRMRMMTAQTSTFHDAMYHSAIAARLASEFPDGSGR